MNRLTPSPETSFTRALQAFLRTVHMYQSVSHVSVRDGGGRAFSALQRISSHRGQVHLTFAGDHALVNGAAFTDPSVVQLQKQCYAKGISGLTFTAKATLDGFLHAAFQLAALLSGAAVRKTFTGADGLVIDWLGTGAVASHQVSRPQTSGLFSISGHDGEVLRRKISAALRSGQFPPELSPHHLASLEGAVTSSARPDESRELMIEVATGLLRPASSLSPLECERVSVGLLNAGLPEVLVLSLLAPLHLPVVEAHIKEYARLVALPVHEQVEALLSASAWSPAQRGHAIYLLAMFGRHADLTARDAVSLIVRCLEGFHHGVQDDNAKRFLDALRNPCMVPLWRQLEGQVLPLLHAGRGLPFHTLVAAVLNCFLQTLTTAGKFREVSQILTQLRPTASITGHELCCQAAVSHALSTAALDQVLEAMLRKEPDALALGTHPWMFRLLNDSLVEHLFVRLEQEPSSQRRLALLRILRFTGRRGALAARKRLHDGNWFVKRNAIQLLGQFKDPDLLHQVSPLLRDRDAKVQMAAAQVIWKSGLAGREIVLAEALPAMFPSVSNLVRHEMTISGERATMEARALEDRSNVTLAIAHLG